VDAGSQPFSRGHLGCDVMWLREVHNHFWPAWHERRKKH